MSKRVKKAAPSTLATIRGAMKACRKKEVRIVAGSWGAEFDAEAGYFVTDSDKPQACALGALLIHKNGSVNFKERFKLRDPDIEEAAAYVLGVDEDWVVAFVRGFDDSLAEDLSSIHGKLGVDVEQDEDSGEDVVVWKKPRSAQTAELRRAYQMGLKLRSEFIK